MYNVIAILASILLPTIIMKDSKKNLSKTNLKEYIIENKNTILIYCIFVIGFLIRLVGIVEYPYGLNQDEASAGYEAFSVLKYGIDRKGNSLPVHFIAWGSGQNVLYSYLMMPFIAILGLNVLSVRLPMAIVGCISLVVIYKLLKMYNKKIALIGLVFFVICPWHIMKSRWGLESNLFPDMVLWAIYLLIKAINDKKMYKFYISIAVLSLAVYSYGTSYLFLPIFLAMILLYLLKSKKITIKNAIISLIIAGVIALPMMLFVCINTFDLQEIHLGFITVPRVYKNRYQEVTTIFSSKFISTIYDNFKYNMKILVGQTDGTTYNSIPYFGIIYIFSLPFTLIGMIDSIKNRKLLKNINNFWFLTSIILVCICAEANINRLNICMIPLILYTIQGLDYIIKNDKTVIIAISLMYCVSFTLFGVSYINIAGNKNTPFTKNIEEPLKYISQLNVEQIYIKKAFVQPYIYTLFYTKYNTKDFINTVEYYSEKVAFEEIKSFGKFKFYIPETLDESDSAYMVPVNFQYDTSKFKETNFGDYKVLEKY